MSEGNRHKDLNKAARKEMLVQRGKRAKLWYYSIGVLLSLFGLLILGATAKTALIDGPTWNRFAASMRSPDVYSSANRGNIYADNGTALAISVPMYTVRIDFRAAGFKDSLFLANVDALSDSLSRYFGDRSKGSYKSQLMAGYSKKRQIKIIDFEVNHTQLKAMRKMPYLSYPNSNVSGLVTEMAIRREKPFGTMASRTIGFLKRDVDSLGVTHGSSGLELAFDSLLCGVPGIDMKIRIPKRSVRKTKIPSIDGKDVYTTLNPSIQDITERSLRDMLIEVNADWGCAIVMEVKTGAIKAISNLDRFAEGVYAESTNHAVADLLEPGSTFKVPSILAALEEGYCHPEDTVDVGNGLFPYAKRVVRDHNAHRGGYGKITIAQSIWFSSNVGVAKTILKGFETRPEKYLEWLDKMSFFDPIHLEIPGTAKAYIDRDVKNWDRTKLPWVSFGYGTMVPPLYMCRFYNAIANNGKMMEPYIVSTVEAEGKVLLRNKPKVVNKKIASNQSLSQMRQMLRDVVEKGTAKDVDSPHILIAGKTGTAQRSAGKAGYAGQGHNVAFCGFFPYDNPQYTCMVTVSRPRNGYPSGGRIAGGILRNIAEQIYATTMTVSLSDMVPDSTAVFDTEVLGGRREAVKNAVDISQTKDLQVEKGDWLYHGFNEVDSVYMLNTAVVEEGVVPHLVGMVPRDALYLAESLGLRVQIIGFGREVVRQSIPPGRKFTNNPTLILTLK